MFCKRYRLNCFMVYYLLQYFSTFKRVPTHFIQFNPTTTLEDIWSIMVNSWVRYSKLHSSWAYFPPIPSRRAITYLSLVYPNSIFLLLPAFVRFQTMLRYITFFPRCCLICKVYSRLKNLKVYTNYTSKSKTENKQEILFSRFKSY